MTDVGTLTLSDFLLARIAEDADILDTAGINEPYRTRFLDGFEAKRRIVEAWQADETGPLGEWDDYAWYAIKWAMKCLALPYADHPDYRSEWAV